MEVEANWILPARTSLVSILSYLTSDSKRRRPRKNSGALNFFLLQHVDYVVQPGTITVVHVLLFRLRLWLALSIQAISSSYRHIVISATVASSSNGASGSHG